jgi:glycerol kinase
MPVLAIDAGTTGVTALVVGEDGDVLARGYREFAQLFPRPGWVEHEPEDIWTATVAACRQALAGTDARPTCVGITDQRETAVVWDRRTLRSPRPAIVWQDRRTTGICDRLRADGVEPRSPSSPVCGWTPTSPARSSPGWPSTSRRCGPGSGTAPWRWAPSTPT